MRVLLLSLLLATSGWAANLPGEFGTMSALATATTHADAVSGCSGRRAIVFLFGETEEGGATFTGNIQESIDAGTTWVDVAGSATSTDDSHIGIRDPVGLYRPELSACSSCSVTVKWRCAGK